MTSPRVFFYVQHLLGIGHLRRAAAIAGALIEAGAEVDFVLGGEPVEGIAPPKAKIVQLPPAVASDAQFTHLLDDQGNKVDERWKVARKQTLLGAFAASRPDIVLIEMYPFGRRQFRFELLPLLDEVAATRPKPLIAVSVRDILVDKGRMDRAREAVDIIKRSIDRVLVHGDPRLTRFDLTFPLATEIADRLSYTGFVVERQAPNAALDRGKGEILVSAGGGAVGFPLLSAAIRAKRMTRHRHRMWRIVTGANLPDAQRKELDKLAAGDTDIKIDSYRPDFGALMASCHLSISQAGYNTVMELIALKCPAVVVPFAEGGESEQTLRARMLTERRVLGMVDPEFLTPGTLAAAVDAAQAPAELALNLDGARQSAVDLIAAWRQKRAVGQTGGMSSWDDLARECDAWTAEGRPVELWWRDDDAIEDTPALRRLLALTQDRAPIALAIIPATLTPSLAPLVEAAGKTVSVLQHGYDHGNRAAAGAKKSEFPASRPAAEVTQVLAVGRDRLHDQFADRFVPALTPPWNRFDPRHLSLLPDLGYRGLTTYLPRPNTLAAPGIAQVNTHVDVIDWHGTRGFLGLGPTLDLLIGHLAAKRGGQADAAEPTGLLTHHLVHDRETWEFLEAFLGWCAGRPGIRWRGAAELFPMFGA